MEDIKASIRKLKELFGYEFDYEWNENEPPIKETPRSIPAKAEAILDIFDSIENYLEEQTKRSNGFYD